VGTERLGALKLWVSTGTNCCRTHIHNTEQGVDYGRGMTKNESLPLLNDKEIADPTSTDSNFTRIFFGAGSVRGKCERRTNGNQTKWHS
jgi:hypothetical protein